MSLTKRRPPIYREELDLPHEIQFVQQADNVAGWTNVTNGAVWANVQPATSKEMFAASQRQTPLTHTIRMWQSSQFTIDNDMRIKMTDNYSYPAASATTKVFQIVGVRQDSYMDRMLIIDAVERPRWAGEV